MPRTIFVVVLIAAATGFAAAPTDPNAVFAQTLAVQMAIKTGREALQRGDAKAAVTALEAHVGRCNGNTDYLIALRDAYSAYVKDLQLHRRDAECAVFLERLKILDKSVNADPKPQPPQPQQPTEVARGSRPDDDPLQQTPKRRTPSQEVLADAEKAFREQRYPEADKLFAQAFGKASDVPAPHAAQWAYCKFAAVVALIQQSEAVLSAEAEAELAAGVRLAGSDPKLEPFGKQLCNEAQRRRGGAAPAAASPAPAVEVKHTAKSDDGWARAQSENFRLFHDQPKEYAEQVLRAAEQARAVTLVKWGGDAKAAWKTPCDVYVHATAADYAKASGKSATGPGHATMQMKGTVVEKRRLDLRADEPNTVTNVVPHETTHLVLADLFDSPLPRWADEAIAVLAEPPAQIDRYRKTLNRCRNVEKKLVPLVQLFKQAEYPAEAGQITAFYCESVSVVEFLIAEKGPETLVAFLKDVQNGAKLDATVQRHYGFSNVKELQDRWLCKTWPDEVKVAAAQ